MKNLELKIRIGSVDSLKAKLAGLSIGLEKVIRQKDVYYKIDSGLLKLRVMETNSELIYYNRDESSEERWSDYEILNVDGSNPEAFLANLFNVEVVVEKTRNLYLYGNTRIHVDEVKNLGSFLELESVVAESEAEAKAEFEKVVDLLGIDVAAQLKCSYHDLMLELN